MKIAIQYGIPFVQLEVHFRGKKLILDKVLLDTGSAGTIFNANVVDEIGVVPEENDLVDTIRGVGGVEYVYVKRFNSILFRDICKEDFQVEIGNMDYGMDIDGILGFDFISVSNLIIDTEKMMVYASEYPI
ncbi:retropepsin-like aspartic protease [Bacillus sp. DJP31]|uniref:retropepsin-like aspartic protease n=1 Tax=Bacillus sp. DJP31 TaxID=3409789 RepID=UPI003BB6D656